MPVLPLLKHGAHAPCPAVQKDAVDDLSGFIGYVSTNKSAIMGDIGDIQALMLEILPHVLYGVLDALFPIDFPSPGPAIGSILNRWHMLSGIYVVKRHPCTRKAKQQRNEKGISLFLCLHTS